MKHTEARWSDVRVAEVVLPRVRRNAPQTRGEAREGGAFLTRSPAERVWSRSPRFPNIAAECLLTRSQPNKLPVCSK